ncbi:ArsR family transcriptional regulator [Vibrio sinensis]|uniref:ArsR family transcriptional regulator n=1 Tax=Vibrio sinensis TaxID=2302434 RepID=A0A3A6RFB2_9VIBR|nr:winged helix-turn-helix domain-containing protein [Vibrio sinensis]RJX75391.1 ArsR family transcriptional regulator [Vibrio sinensis]
MSSCSTPESQNLQATQEEIAQEALFAQKAKALSHPARVRILTMLCQLDRQGGCLNCDLVSELGLAQSTVSEHLRILKLAGFISAESNPPKVCYRVIRSEIDQFQALLGKIFN